MKSPILRQLAIAMTPDGLIGAGKDLLFSNPSDLSNFAHFTQHTVLIAGRKTAEQMVGFGVNFRINRPIIVISEFGLVDIGLPIDAKYMYYASSLDKALKMAEQITERFQLNGYTVVGGATVYEEFVDLLDKGKTQVNRAYMFVADIGERDILDPVKLSRTAEQLRLTILNRQTDPGVGIGAYDVALCANLKSGDASKGEKVENKQVMVRGKNCRFEYITDGEDFDTDSAHLVEGRLKLRLSTGVVVLRTADISYWEERSGVNSVNICMKNGQIIDARTAKVSGLNWLKVVLKKVLL